MEVFENERVDTLRTLKLLFQKKWLILTAGVLGFAVAYVITLSIPPKYTSFGVVYPSNSVTRNQLLENPQFGYEIDADRLMQVLESERIRNAILEKYDLGTYYDIDTTDLTWRQQLDKKFMNDITFSRTKYMSIVISARMKDPDLAADVVNSITDIADDVQEEIYRNNLDAEFNAVKSGYFEKKRRVEAIVDSIFLLKGPRIASSILYDHLLGTQDPVQTGKSNEYIDSPQMAGLVTAYKLEQKRLEELKDEYEKAKTFYYRPFPANYVIDRAKPSYLRSTPSFKRNIAAGTISALFFAVLFILFQDWLSKLWIEIRKT